MNHKSTTKFTVMKTTQLISVINQFKFKIEKCLSIKIELSHIEAYICNGYIQLSYNNNDYIIRAEVSPCGNEYILTGIVISE